jgi:hypothetical protein
MNKPEGREGIKIQVRDSGRMQAQILRQARQNLFLGGLSTIFLLVSLKGSIGIIR